MVEVPVGDLTDRQALVAILRELKEMRNDMAQLSEAVADLQVAVQGVLDRVGPTVDALKVQIAAGEAALAAFAEADAVEDANYEAAAAALQAALQAQVDGATAAADAIEAQVATLNTVAAPPAEPEGEVVPVEDPTA